MGRLSTVALLCLAALASCSTPGAGRRPASASTTAAPPTTVAAAATTESPPPTTTRTTTAAPVALIPQETPDLAATALLTAWRAGDRHGALVVAAPSAVDTLFSRPSEDFSDRGCQDPLNGQSNCAFGAGGGLIRLETVTLAGGWVVQHVTFEAP